MSDRAVVELVRTAAIAGGVLAAMGSVAIIAMDAGSWWSEGVAFLTLFPVFFAFFVWVAASHQPRNAVVWTMAASAFFAGVYVAGLAAAAVLVVDPVLVLGEPAPADLPTTAAWILVFTYPLATVGVWWLMFGLLLFPDGRLPSRRWRWVVGFAVAGILVATAGSAWSFRPGNTGTANEGPLITTGLAILGVAAVLVLLALVIRFRRSRGSTRDQFKWVVWGASIFVLAVVVSIVFRDTRYENLATGLITLAAAALLAAYGIAVSRYQLFDIDVVISRTVVVAGLAGFITFVYAALVGGVGLLVGFGTDAVLPLSIAATVVVAIAFQPLRLRMRRWADRLVYGERATPYEVLSRFSERLRDTVATEDVIPQMAQLLTAGTGAEQAVVWTKSGTDLLPMASWPKDNAVPTQVAADDGERSIPGVDYSARVEHDGELLGAVTLTMPRGEVMTATERRLVDDVASQAGLVLRNVRLIEQLRSSRQRLVAAQDEERRRLERDLHDGAQQQLIAIKMNVTVAQRLAESGESDRAVELLQQVAAETTDAVEALRDLAHGIYPPLLEAEGLEAALKARAAKAPVATSVGADGLGRYAPEIEAAVYFCVLESVQNAVKYAEAHSVSITLRDQDGQLVFDVTDDGKGFDTEATAQGRGLVNMADRLDAFGGSLDVRSTPGRGTTVTGRLHTAATFPKSSP